MAERGVRDVQVVQRRRQRSNRVAREGLPLDDQTCQSGAGQAAGQGGSETGVADQNERLEL